MSKKDILLNAFLKNIGEWVCGYCNSGSNQPAATFREIKKLGYEFEEYSPNRWGKDKYCHKCQNQRTHYKLLSANPKFSVQSRISIVGVERTRVITLLEGKDAFTGASISSTPEIDHKTPWTRLDKDIDTKDLSNDEIKNHFQLLTREHNLLKDRACGSCKVNNIRPPFIGINYWYKGDQNYNDTCEGCGWYDGKKWRESINNKLK
jgi:hypothetical protein